MDVYVVNPSYQVVSLIDDYKSLIWTKRYSEFGDCELYVKASLEALNVLKKGWFLTRNDDDMICRIMSIELDTDAEEGNYLIVKGYDCRGILAQRIIWEQTNFSGTVENYIRKLVTDSIISPSVEARKITNFKLGTASGFTDTIDEQATYDALDEKIIDLCQTYGYGSRVTLDDDGNFVFTLYQGIDRSYAQESNDYVVFSPDFDNIVSSKYLIDSSNVRNVALIAGEGEGVERKRVAYGNASGLDRYELYVDARDVSSKTDEGATVKYNEALKARGIENLSRYGVITLFEGEVEPNYSYKYKTDYQLGDIVQVVNEYGIEVGARITEVIESFDQDGYTVVPTFEYMEVVR